MYTTHLNEVTRVCFLEFFVFHRVVQRRV